MSFVEQDDILKLAEGVVRAIFKELVGAELPAFKRMPYDVAMRDYGIDKPDIRFEMFVKDLTSLVHGQAATADFPLFRDAELVLALAVPTYGALSSKKLKDLEKKAKTDTGASAMIWAKCVDLKAGKLESSAKKCVASRRRRRRRARASSRSRLLATNRAP